MSAAEDYLDQRIRLVELRELECQRRERQLEDTPPAPSVTAGELVRRSALRILELEHELADALEQEDYLDQRIRLVELALLELEHELADALEQRDAARTLAARLEAETASCPTWIFHRIDELDDPARDEARP